MPRSTESLQSRRIVVFLVVAFGVSWAVAGVLYATGGLTASRELLPGVTLATVLLPTGYMFGPAIGNVVARLATGEGSANLYLHPGIEGGRWKYYVAAWLVPAVLVAVGAAVFYAVFPGLFDPAMTYYEAVLEEQLAATGQPLPFGVETLVLIEVAAALTVAPLVNAVFAFGEEFGWRAYLLPKLLPLGAGRASVVVGLVWGVWHWPVIAMGYNYGFGYAGAPWTGMAAMLAFTVGAGVFLAWVTLREGSVWPAAIGHGAINAVAGIGLYVFAGDAAQSHQWSELVPLLGPAPVGVLAALPWLALAAWLVLRSGGLAPAGPAGPAGSAGPSSRDREDPLG